MFDLPENNYARCQTAEERIDNLEKKVKVDREILKVLKFIASSVASPQDTVGVVYLQTDVRLERSVKTLDQLYKQLEEEAIE